MIQKNYTDGPPPQISIVIACYNYGKHLPGLLLSLADQPYRDFELIIVNDGSTDDSLAAARRLMISFEGRLPITLIDQENQGVSAARNNGLHHARGEYFLYLDPDDELHPDFFRETVRAIDDDPQVDVLYVGMSTFGDYQYTYIPPDFDPETLKYWNFIPGYALFRRKVFEMNGGFRSNVPSHEDWDFWLNAASRGFRFKAVKKPLFYYRTHRESLSARMKARRKQLVGNVRLNNRRLYDDIDLEWARKAAGSDLVRPYEGKKVLLLTEYFPPNPAPLSREMSDLAVALTKSGFMTEVGTNVRENRYSYFYNGINVYDFEDQMVPLTKKETLDFGPTGSLIREGGYDLLLAAGSPMNWPIWAAGSPENPPVIFMPVIDRECFENLNGNQAFDQRLEQLLRKGRAVLCTDPSGFEARYLSSRNIPYVFLPRAVPFVSPTTDFRRAAKISPDRNLLLCVSPYAPRENQLAMIRRLKDMPGDWTLATIGHPLDGEYLESIRREVLQDERFLILDALDSGTTASAMACADLLLVPSCSESFPKTVLEAMSLRLPWIGSDDITSLKGQTGGLTVSLDDFPSEIQRLLQQPSEWKNLGLAGFDHWYGAHRPDHVAELVLGVAGHLPDRSEAVYFRRNPLQSRKDYVSRLRSPVRERPLVSVIIPTFNRPDLLAEALQSVTHQTYGNIEIIVVNDHGVDVAPLISRLNDSRVIYHKNAENLGLAGSRNVGVNLAKGRYIAYLDDDDLYYPSHIETLVEVLERTGGKAAYTDSYQVVEALEGNIWKRKKKFLRFSVDFNAERLFARNIAPVNCFMHTRDIFFEAGGFDETLTVLEDWDLWIRMAMKHDFLHIREITCEVRLREDKENMSFERADHYAGATAAMNAKYGGLVFSSRDRSDKRTIRNNLQIISEFEKIRQEHSLQTALDFLEKTLCSGNDSPYLEYFCAQAWLEAGDPERARDSLERCLALHPNDQDALNDLAVLEYTRFSNRTGAVAILERSLKVNPGHKDTRLNLADICAESGLGADAAAHVSALLGLYPEDPEIQARRVYLHHGQDLSLPGDSMS